MSIDEPAHKRDQHRTDQQVELMQSAAHVIPMLAEFLTGVAKRSAPGKRSQKGEHQERPKVHAGDAGR